MIAQAMGKRKYWSHEAGWTDRRHDIDDDDDSWGDWRAQSVKQRVPEPDLPPRHLPPIEENHAGHGHTSLPWVSAVPPPPVHPPRPKGVVVLPPRWRQKEPAPSLPDEACALTSMDAAAAGSKQMEKKRNKGPQKGNLDKKPDRPECLQTELEMKSPQKQELGWGTQETKEEMVKDQNAIASHTDDGAPGGVAFAVKEEFPHDDEIKMNDIPASMALPVSAPEEVPRDDEIEMNDIPASTALPVSAPEEVPRDEEDEALKCEHGEAGMPQAAAPIEDQVPDPEFQIGSVVRKYLTNDLKPTKDVKKIKKGKGFRYKAGCGKGNSYR